MIVNVIFCILLVYFLYTGGLGKTFRFLKRQWKLIEEVNKTSKGKKDE